MTKKKCHILAHKYLKMEVKYQIPLVVFVSDTLQCLVEMTSSLCGLVNNVLFYGV